MRVKVVCFDRLLQVLILNGLVQGFSREARRCGTGLQVSINTRKSSTKVQCVSITFWVSFERSGKVLNGRRLDKLGLRAGKREKPGKWQNGQLDMVEERSKAPPSKTEGRAPRFVSPHCAWATRRVVPGAEVVEAGFGVAFFAGRISD